MGDFKCKTSLKYARLLIFRRKKKNSCQKRIKNQ